MKCANAQMSTQVQPVCRMPLDGGGQIERLPDSIGRTESAGASAALIFGLAMSLKGASGTQ
jgi:hypothetical protein